MVPFIAWDLQAFYDATIAYYLHGSLRPDSLSLTAYFSNAMSWNLPSVAIAILYAATGLGSLIWLARQPHPHTRSLLGIAAVVYAVAFLFGRLAFCNYYYFVAFLAWCFVLLSAADDRAESRRQMAGAAA
jgi:hypothetical protein